jgi:hypothetical protein
MDRYDALILKIIQSYPSQEGERGYIGLKDLESEFWKHIEADAQLNLVQGRIGERVTALYVSGLIENKDGYRLTRKGRSGLQLLRPLKQLL